MTLTEAAAHIGDKVIYDRHGNAVNVEEGVITSVSDRCVLVRYGSDIGSKATRPEDLALAGGEA